VRAHVKFLDSRGSAPTRYARRSWRNFAIGFNRQRELAETARQLVARGCHVVLSNSDAPYVRRLYKGFKIDRVKCRRAINSNTERRGDVDELIIVGNVGARTRRSR
jgi:site-specific DNA-adenine methylase